MEEKEMLMFFSDWLGSSGFKNKKKDIWTAFDLPFQYTTEEIVNEFYKDLEDGKIRINKQTT